MTKTRRYNVLRRWLHIIVDSTQASLWGIETNYPGTDNSYLTEVANELLPEAIAAGRETLTRLVSHADAREGT
ncbi:MAG: hypothetical protein VR75_04115 [Hyphomonadaceae bacterium BRH_c29]|nr:MAG: hypothetical protein VR75_04115 [Hyphomonadaceae bacterium BRH_c29]